MGPFLADIPSLVFCLHLLSTEMNKDKVLESVEGLSMIYLSTIGPRIDILSCSNILSGWAQTGMRNPEMFKMLSELVVDKHKEGAFLDSGGANALVNTLKSMVQLGFSDDQFQQVIIDGLVDYFDELDIVWATMLFKQLG